MAAQGFYNHYDDPDEYWDEEPLEARHAVSPRPTPAFAEPVPPAPILHDAEGSASSSGSSFATMQLDSGFLPTRVDLSAGWDRYVQPHQVGEELLRAYKAATVQQFAPILAAGKWLAGDWSGVECGIPPRRTQLIALLQTCRWADYQAKLDELISDKDYRVHGRALYQGEPGISMTADRSTIRSISVRVEWVQSIDLSVVIDDVLWCADQIRALRPKFASTEDFSRYSDDDLEYQHQRHFQRLLEQSGN